MKYFRFHPLRHAGASLMDSINVPTSDIQLILGHERRKTTEIYIHSNDNRKVRAIERYELARKKIKIIIDYKIQ